MSELWRRCLQRLESDLTVEDLHTYLKPLQATEDSEGLRLLGTAVAVREKFLGADDPATREARDALNAAQAGAKT